MSDGQEFLDKHNAYNDALLASDELRDTFSATGFFPFEKIPEKSKEYLLYGVTKRLRCIWEGYRWIIFKLPVEREEPLSSEELNLSSLHINSIYLHIRGTLDNLAWAIWFKVNHSKAEELETKPTNVGIFNENILEVLNGVELGKILTSKKKWGFELKERRDPAAHRMPLTITGSFLTPAEGNIYRDLNQKAVKSAINEDYKNSTYYYNEMAKVGKFHPFFHHSLEAGLIPIYPALTDDIKNTIEVCNAVIAFLKRV